MLNPAKVVVLGGLGSVFAMVEAQLAVYAESVVRWDGADRNAISASISETNFSAGAAKVCVAIWLASGDALATGPVAGMNQGPILW